MARQTGPSEVLAAEDSMECASGMPMLATGGSLEDAPWGSTLPTTPHRNPFRSVRAVALGLVVAGAFGCAYSASQLAAKKRQQQVVRGELATVQEFTLTGEEPAFITWKEHPAKCWGLPESLQNGQKLVMRDCPDNPEKFFVPAGGTGTIRPAKHPDFCLDAPRGGTVVQWYKCKEGPESNMQWIMPEDREGGIKPANSEDRCLDVIAGRTEDGTPLQQWRCNAKARDNEGFIVHWPADCRWKEWTEWTTCSSKCKGGQLTRQRTASDAGGAQCNGHETEQRQCGTENCTPGHNGGRSGHEVPRALIFGLCFLCSLEHLVRW